MFTGIEGSTNLVRELGAGAFDEVLGAHHELVRRELRGRAGREIDVEGDAFFAVFETASAAAVCAVAIHHALESAVWPVGVHVRVRIALHTGTVEERDGRLLGLDVHQGARISAAAHGGQTLVSQSTRILLDTGFTDVIDLGEHSPKDIPGSVRLFQIAADGRDFPPPRTADGRVVRLPPLRPDLVGRDADVARVEEAWAQDFRPVTLVGPAGIGKTSLALDLAHRRVDLGHSVVMVPLVGAHDAAEVLPAIRSAIGVEGGGGDEIFADARAKVLRGWPLSSAVTSR